MSWGPEESVWALRIVVWCLLAVAILVSAAMALSVGPFRSPVSAKGSGGIRILPNRPRKKILESDNIEKRTAEIARYRKRVDAVLEREEAVKSEARFAGLFRVAWVPAVSVFLASLVCAVFVVANDFLFKGVMHPLEWRGLSAVVLFALDAIKQSILSAYHLDFFVRSAPIAAHPTGVGVDYVVQFQRFVFSWSVPALVNQLIAFRQLPSYVSSAFAELSKISGMTDEELLDKFVEDKHIKSYHSA
jgi:hypothetical protein